MRTTLTLDADVARLVEDAMHRERRPMKQVINDALRTALARPGADRPRFTVEVHSSGVQPGFDLAGFNRLADELEDQAILAAARKPDDRR
jgi:hypothetical protein